MDLHMMDLTDEQKQMRAVSRDFVDKEVIPYMHERREEEWTKPANQRQPWDLLKALWAFPKNMAASNSNNKRRLLPSSPKNYRAAILALQTS
jgi:hypothetical protein